MGAAMKISLYFVNIKPHYDREPKAVEGPFISYETAYDVMCEKYDRWDYEISRVELDAI
jgi:hypothetical protein